MHTEEKPAKKVRNVQQDKKLEDKGLNPETVTKDQIAEGLRIVLNFKPTDKGPTLFAKPEKGKRHVKVAYMSSESELVERLVAKLEPLQVEFTRGTSSIKRKIPGFNKKSDFMQLGLDTLEFDISDDQRKETRALMATFINEEAAKNPIMWACISEIQRAHNKHASVG